MFKRYKYTGVACENFGLARERNNRAWRKEEEMEKFARVIVAVVLVVLVIISKKLMAREVNFHEINLGWVLLALVVAYLVLSFSTTKQDEIGMMTFFDRPIKNLKKGSGLYFAPIGIISVKKERGTVFQDELPADPEKIFRDDGKVPDKMFPPIRVKFGQPGPTDIPNPDPVDVALKDDPYNVAMVAEVVPVVSWHIEDAITFFGVMGSIENCRKILADKAIELFGEKFANITPAKAALTLNDTSRELEVVLKKEAETGGWGVMINDAYVKPIIFTHKLNDSVIGVSVAQQNAKAKVHDAEGSAKTVKIAAKAEKKRLTTTGLAKTDKDGNITELVPDANVRINAEAIKELAKVTGTLVLGSNVTPVINVQKGDK
jgi:regulator of protease activity HflC (stomatin/prohibitin superfamily)